MKRANRKLISIVFILSLIVLLITITYIVSRDSETSLEVAESNFINNNDGLILLDKLEVVNKEDIYLLKQEEIGTIQLEDIYTSYFAKLVDIPLIEDGKNLTNTLGYMRAFTETSRYLYKDNTVSEAIAKYGFGSLELALNDIFGEYLEYIDINRTVKSLEDSVKQYKSDFPDKSTVTLFGQSIFLNEDIILNNKPTSDNAIIVDIISYEGNYLITDIVPFDSKLYTKKASYLRTSFDSPIVAKYISDRLYQKSFVDIISSPEDRLVCHFTADQPYYVEYESEGEVYSLPFMHIYCRNVFGKNLENYAKQEVTPTAINLYLAPEEMNMYYNDYLNSGDSKFTMFNSENAYFINKDMLD